jgi:ATP-dependent exoDNAse (exonuclease V) beta subunit
VDFKSHRLTDPGRTAVLAEHYRPQLAAYGEAAARLWPGRRVELGLIFTAEARVLRLT